MSIRGLTDGPLTGGVYRLLNRPADVLDRLQAAGWRAGVAADVTTAAAFYQEVATALGFPAWFGGNLDALWDCLTDLTEPTALLLTGWPDLARNEPGRWTRILGVLFERTEVSPPFAVVLVGGAA